MRMTNGIRAERIIAKRYEEQGYSVVAEPPPSAIPFSLKGYRPDILATKGDENLLIEVKSPGARTDRDTYFELADEVGRHPGWRFLLVTVADEELRPAPEGGSGTLNISAIKNHLLQLDRLLEISISPGILLPQLWLVYIGVLRLLVERESGNLDQITDLSLVNKAYSDGLISNEEHQAGRRLLKLRNEAAHSIASVGAQSDCKDLRRMVDGILHRLEEKPID